MRGRGQVPPSALARSLERAKRLVAGHLDPAVPPGDRLREIGKNLKVTRIEPGAMRAAGFLNKQTDGTFAICYANDMLERRRFTVAHELAHLILDKYHKHLRFDQTQSTLATHSSAVEKAVDRIAAELLMPEALVVRLLRDNCSTQRESSVRGEIDKRKVVQAVGKGLGVSELALVLRLLELKDLLAIQLEFEWTKDDPFTDANRVRISQSQHGCLRIDSYSYPSRATLERSDGWELPVFVTTTWGRRTIHCHAWRRSPFGKRTDRVKTWIVGWTWNTFPAPKWDDSEVHSRKGTS